MKEQNLDLQIEALPLANLRCSTSNQSPKSDKSPRQKLFSFGRLLTCHKHLTSALGTTIVAKLNRFEITIQCAERRVKHVCAAEEETEAVERIMRSYANSDPELVLVKRLGALPTPRGPRGTRKQSEIR